MPAHRNTVYRGPAGNASTGRRTLRKHHLNRRRPDGGQSTPAMNDERLEVASGRAQRVPGLDPMVSARDDRDRQQVGSHHLAEDGDARFDRYHLVIGSEEGEQWYANFAQGRARVVADDRRFELPLEGVRGEI